MLIHNGVSTHHTVLFHHLHLSNDCFLKDHSLHCLASKNRVNDDYFEQLLLLKANTL